MKSENVAIIIIIGAILIMAFGLPRFIQMTNKANVDFYNKTFGASYTEHEFYWNKYRIMRYHDKNFPKRPETNNINATLKFEQ